MNGDPGDLRKVLFHAVFQRAGDVMDQRDREASIHGAVARRQDLLLHLADVDVMAIHQLVVFLRQRVDVFFDRPGEPCHLSALPVDRSDVRSERLDVNIYDRIDAFRGSSHARKRANLFLKFGGAAMRVPQAQVFRHFQMQFDKQPPVELVRGYLVDGKSPPGGDGANGVK